MKNVLKTWIFTIMMLLFMTGTVLAKGNDIQVKVSRFSEWGQISQFSLELGSNEKPRIEKGRVLIPLRKISESFGYTVTFDQKTKQINMADSDGKKMELVLSSKKALVNNKRADLDVPAKVIRGVTFVPIRFVSENFDQVVKWDTKTRTVEIDNFTISTPEYLFNQKTLELSRRDESCRGKHLLLGKIPMFVDWVSMNVTKTENGNDLIVITNNTGAPHIFYEIHTIYVSENKIIDQSVINTLFPKRSFISPDGEKAIISDGKTARVYDDKTKKLVNEYDLLALFEAEKEPNPDSSRETTYAVLAFGDNYILVRDSFKMLTRLVYLDTKEIVDIYQVLLSEEEQKEALKDSGPFGNGDGLYFIEEKNSKLIFNKSYYEAPEMKTIQVEYKLASKPDKAQPVPQQ